MVKFDDRGLVPAVVQDASSGRVLTLAYMNEEALRRTIAGPDVWFYSRSRKGLWHKGETSGSYLKVREVAADCDSDAVLVKAISTGPACHTGAESCFHNAVEGAAAPGAVEQAAGPGVLADLSAVIAERRASPPAGSYSAKLFAEGAPRIAQKVVEEAGETALAAVTDPKRLASETADLFYHALVLLEAAGVSPNDVWRELQSRRK
jgi:phosphoribosyl-ATP pyrophosphohydrolase/phosphoribosyl-AMP cyclohydrolase